MMELLEQLSSLQTRPGLFEQGEACFWDDPHISRSMLEAHLNGENDLASRKMETIDRTIRHWLDSGILKQGFRVLDLGCGPGLYVEKLKMQGMDVVGLDISQRSLAYAREHAESLGLEMDYRCMNFLEIDFCEEFDAVIQVYGELNTFPDAKRDTLLKKIHKALKKNGVFIFDVSTSEGIQKAGCKNRWYFSLSGFWRSGPHMVLEEGYHYPQDLVWLDQYIVVDSQGSKAYRNWFKAYSADSMGQVLEQAGFRVKHIWNDLTGCTWKEGGDWIAVIAEVNKA